MRQEGHVLQDYSVLLSILQSITDENGAKNSCKRSVGTKGSTTRLLSEGQ